MDQFWGEGRINSLQCPKNKLKFKMCRYHTKNVTRLVQHRVWISALLFWVVICGWCLNCYTYSLLYPAYSFISDSFRRVVFQNDDTGNTGTCISPVFAVPPVPLTALASCPGSGNSWLRHLLQQATGILTGSMYYDKQLYLMGFHGEGISNSSVLAVKTHSSNAEVMDLFHQAILLVRNPYDVILAEFNRQHAGHIGHASQKAFKEHWDDFILPMLDIWLVFNSRWLSFGRSLYVIHYRDLLFNLNSTLVNLLHFLNVTFSNEALECTLQKSQGRLKRPRTDQYFKLDLFAPKARMLIDQSKHNFSNELLNFQLKRKKYN